MIWQRCLLQYIRIWKPDVQKLENVTLLARRKCQRNVQMKPYIELISHASIVMLKSFKLFICELKTLTSWTEREERTRRSNCKNPFVNSRKMLSIYSHFIDNAKVISTGKLWKANSHISLTCMQTTVRAGALLNWCKKIGKIVSRLIFNMQSTSWGNVQIESESWN